MVVTKIVTEVGTSKHTKRQLEGMTTFTLNIMLELRIVPVSVVARWCENVQKIECEIGRGSAGNPNTISTATGRLVDLTFVGCGNQGVGFL